MIFHWIIISHWKVTKDSKIFKSISRWWMLFSWNNIVRVESDINFKWFQKRRKLVQPENQIHGGYGYRNSLAEWKTKKSLSLREENAVLSLLARLSDNAIRVDRIIHFLDLTWDIFETFLKLFFKIVNFKANFNLTVVGGWGKLPENLPQTGSKILCFITQIEVMTNAFRLNAEHYALCWDETTFNVSWVVSMARKELH